MKDRIARLKQSDAGKSRALELFYFRSDSADVLNQLTEQTSYGIMKLRKVMDDIYQQMAIDDKARENLEKV